jgi:murein DD-endopeptidase MepM/ murein hydrolase activator NlpD
LRGLLLFLLGGLVGANATYFVMTRHTTSAAQTRAAGVDEAAATPATAAGTRAGGAASARPDTGPVLPPPVVSMHGAAPGGDPAAPAKAAPATSASGLLIPVQGIAATQLSDTFTDARGMGRPHDAIDIMAPSGTPVLAVADGHVEKLFNSKLGGLTIYEFNADGTLAYYYAHLQRYADGLAEQQSISRGQVIGYVGSTGNASPDAPHLHFAIFKLGPEKQWWKGEAINPYPQLRNTTPVQ